MIVIVSGYKSVVQSLYYPDNDPYNQYKSSSKINKQARD